MKKYIAMVLMIVVLCTNGGSSVYAASNVVYKAKTLTLKVHDSIITSWKLVVVKGKFEWHYNKAQKTLTNDKDISYSTPTCVVGCFAKNFKQSYPWWNMGKNQTGKLKLSFTYGTGIDTSWVSIAQKKSACMAVIAKGDGTYSSSIN